MRVRAAALLSGLALSAAGCGSTVAGTSGASQSLGTNDGLSLVAPATVTSTTGPATSTSYSPDTPQTTTDVPATNGTTAPTDVSGPAAISKPGTPITIGVEYSSDYSSTMSSAGFGGIQTGDVKALASTLINEANARGGLLGRQLKIVFHNTSTSQYQNDPSAAAASLCSDFTQDHKVVWAIIATVEAADCFTKAKVPSVLTGVINPQNADQTFLGPHRPYVYMPTAFSMDYLTPLWITRLAANGYFPKTAKVGVLYRDEPSGQRQSKALVAELQQRGVNVATSFGYSNTSASAITTSIASSVLRFRSARVDHVIGLDGNIGVFMISAETQGYHPRYAINTYQGPQSVQVGIDPPDQLAGSIGVGWSALADTDAAHDTFRSTGRMACAKAITASGQNLSSSRSAQFIASSLCDSVQLLLQGATKAQSLQPQAIHDGLATVGQQFSSALDRRSAYSATRSDGAAAVQDLGFNGPCKCFVYLSNELYS